MRQNKNRNDDDDDDNNNGSQTNIRRCLSLEGAEAKLRQAEQDEKEEKEVEAMDSSQLRRWKELKANDGAAAGVAAAAVSEDDDDDDDDSDDSSDEDDTESSPEPESGLRRWKEIKADGAAVASFAATSSVLNTQQVQQRRREELEKVKESAIVDGLYQREQVAARRGRAIVQIQAAVRGFVVRSQMRRIQEKIADLTQHLKDMERGRKSQLHSIMSNPELKSLRENFEDAELARKQQQLDHDKEKVREDIGSVKDQLASIGESMECLRINGRRIAKSTRTIEWECKAIGDCNKILEKTKLQLISKCEQLDAQVTSQEEELARVQLEMEIARAQSKAYQKAILKIREYTKTAAENSTDPFLAKVHKRSQILDRLSSKKKSAMGVCPVVMSS